MAPPHVRLTLEDLQSLYKQNILSAPAVLVLFLRLRCKPGWKVNLNAVKICDLFEMPKTTFWRALHRLRDQNLIEIHESSVSLVSLAAKPEPLQPTKQPTKQPAELSREDVLARIKFCQAAKRPVSGKILDLARKFGLMD